MKKRYAGVLAMLLLLSSCSSDDLKECDKYKTNGAKNICRINFALEKGDVSLCPADYNNCFDIFRQEFQSVSVCDNIKVDRQKDLCYYRFALNLSDTLVCHKIFAAEQRDGCISTVSRKLNDISKCGEISSISYKDSCLLIPSPNKTAQDCGLISLEKLRGQCMLDIAMRSRNYEYCGMAGDMYKRDQCYTAIASLNGDIEKCSLVSDSNLKESCLSSAAKRETDIDICYDLPFELKEACMANIWGSLGKKEFCQTLTIEEEKDRCVRLSST